jgi:hypothetical protein
VLFCTATGRFLLFLRWPPEIVLYQCYLDYNRMLSMLSKLIMTSIPMQAVPTAPHLPQLMPNIPLTVREIRASATECSPDRNYSRQRMKRNANSRGNIMGTPGSRSGWHPQTTSSCCAGSRRSMLDIYCTCSTKLANENTS